MTTQRIVVDQVDPATSAAQSTLVGHGWINGKNVAFVGERRMMTDLRAAIETSGEAEADIEDWQIMPVPPAARRPERGGTMGPGAGNAQPSVLAKVQGAYNVVAARKTHHIGAPGYEAVIEAYGIVLNDMHNWINGPGGLKDEEAQR